MIVIPVRVGRSQTVANVLTSYSTIIGSRILEGVRIGNIFINKYNMILYNNDITKHYKRRKIYVSEDDTNTYTNTYTKCIILISSIKSFTKDEKDYIRDQYNSEDLEYTMTFSTGFREWLFF